MGWEEVAVTRAQRNPNATVGWEAAAQRTGELSQPPQEQQQQARVPAQVPPVQRQAQTRLKEKEERRHPFVAEYFAMVAEEGALQSRLSRPGHLLAQARRCCLGLQNARSSARHQTCPCPKVGGCGQLQAPAARAQMARQE